MFRTILVPLDGSPLAEQALPWALCIARRAGGKLDLVCGHGLHALKEPAACWGPFDPACEADSRQQDRLYLDATALWLSAVSPVPMTTALVRAIPSMDAESILKRVRESGPDLIVMATHGRGAVGRFFLGSTADDLIRQSGAPVLVLHAREPAPSLLPEPLVESVLIPLDGSALAEQALPLAADLARLLEAQCVLLRVVEPLAEGTTAPELEARAYLERLARSLRQQGLQVQTRVVAARHAVEIILEEAETFRSGVIALATHGRSGIGRLLVGSVADRVIRGASCPVLVYRPAAR